MKVKRTILISGVVLLAACGKQESAPSAASPTPAMTPAPAVESGAVPPVNRLAMSTDIPESIRGQDFEPARQCSLDRINGKAQTEPTFEVSRKNGLDVTGWAFNDSQRNVPATVVFQLANDKAKYYALASRDTKRPDLVKAYGVPAYEGAGYDVHADVSQIPTDTYDVLVIMKGDKKNLVCSTLHKVRLVE